MVSLFAEYSAPWLPVAWTLLGLFGFLGLLAILSPRLFASLAVRGGRWVDTDKVINKLNTRVDIDEHILPHSRLLGAAVVVAVGLLGFMLWKF